MLALPDTVTRRVAIVLGTSGAGLQLLNVLQPFYYKALLDRDQGRARGDLRL